jgi:histidyl-tRNA synthetase
MSKPSIPKGTRDFLPEQVLRRDFIFSTIKEVFKAYGYLPIETPALENLSTLQGKYGEEGDRLLFKILNNGNYLLKANEDALHSGNVSEFTSSIARRGLRYDLTVPLARYAVMNKNDLHFPFKRYQIQPVWRADRPQKGRYQEFYQCDVDVIGSSSLIYEAELIKIYDEVFHNLKLDVTIRINNRKVLFGLVEMAGFQEKFTAVTTIIDKLDKIGNEGVLKELLALGMNQEEAGGLLRQLNISSISALSRELESSETGKQGVKELEEVLAYLSGLTIHNEVKLDVSLARGLGYYTGCIVEVLSKNYSSGSIGGGGRYDNLTSIFGWEGVSGVGISFGAERIYDLMSELELFDSLQFHAPSVIFLSMDSAALDYCFKQVMKLRDSKITADIYPEVSKLKKQLKYASNLGFSHAAIVGDREMETGLLSVKNLDTGEQRSMTPDELIQDLSPLS